MGIRYGDRSRVGTGVGRWLNPPLPSVRYIAQIRAPMTTPVTLTADTNAHTYGAWSEVIASVANDSSMLTIRIGNVRTNGVSTQSLISIGTGSAGNEVEFAVFAVGAGGDTATSLQFQLPFRLLSGTRIAARIQSVVTGGKTGTISIQTCDVDPYFFGATNTTVDSLGINTATSRGTNIAASNSYTQIVASTTQTYRGLIVIPSATSGNMQVDIASMTVGVGGSGTEVDLGATVFETNAGETIFSHHQSLFIPAVIPAGSRIAVKQSTIRTYLDATVIGVPL